MIIRPYSDLHNELKRWHPEFKGDEHDIILVLAGDILSGRQQTDVLEEFCSHYRQVVYVPGNHEYWSIPFQEQQEYFQKVQTLYPNLYLLDNKSVVLNGIRFIGTTLWTDMQKENPVVMERCRGGINDYLHIRNRSIIDGHYFNRPITPAETVALHKEAVRFIRQELSNPFEGRTVLVSHHAPLTKSIHEKYKEDKFNAAYASDLSSLFLDFQFDLWIHGHMHDSFDYTFFGKRVVCNPRGTDLYPNTGFDPFKEIEL